MPTRIASQKARELSELLSEAELAALVVDARKRKDEEEQKRRAEEQARRSRERENAVSQVIELLTIADTSLKEAGRIASDYNIDFTFVTPKGQSETYNARWQASACYSWYYEESGYTREVSTVEGKPIDGSNPGTWGWQSSSQNC